MKLLNLSALYQTQRTRSSRLLGMKATDMNMLKAVISRVPEPYGEIVRVLLKFISSAYAIHVLGSRSFSQNNAARPENVWCSRMPSHRMSDTRHQQDQTES